MAEELYYLAVGDSITDGIGSLFSDDFVKGYQKMAEKRLNAQIHVTKVAKLGATSGEILEFLQNSAHVSNKVEKAHIITITAGGNDLLRAAKKFYKNADSGPLVSALAQCKKNLNKILQTLYRYKKNSSVPYIVRIVDLYNPYPERSEARYWVSRHNRQLRELKMPNLRIARVYDAFKGKEADMLFLDRLHPNYKGYRVIAKQLDRLGYRPLI